MTTPAPEQQDLASGITNAATAFLRHIDSIATVLDHTCAGIVRSKVREAAMWAKEGLDQYLAAQVANPPQDTPPADTQGA